MDDLVNKENKLFKKNKVLAEKAKFNEIFISRSKRNPEKIYLERGLELFKTHSVEEIYVCGLGSCLSLAVKISLKITDILTAVKIEEINTSTITHNDDYIDVNSKEVERRCDRNSNLIRIKLKKIN